MTVLQTLYLVLVLGIWSKPRKLHRSKGTVRCASLRWCSDSNLENHLNTEVWNSFLILSCLSVFWTTVSAHAVANLQEIDRVLTKMETDQIFNKSDASLYVPDENTYLMECSNELMYCYLLELYVIAYEEKASENSLQVIHTNKGTYKELTEDRKSSNHHVCPECENHQVNSTVFLKRMKTFIKTLQSIPD
ncbi:interleukin-15 [Astyanax mexicanus]|uniref:Interleukin n=1 Tax=Astyanax mexicanus TaxID=7994 RepID=A0A3B1KFR2_ASTMX|nr:interleukin-15 [Astyanax mexicanus]